MDIAIIKRAIELSQNDGEFQINANWWSGSLTVTENGSGWKIGITRGKFGAPAEASARPQWPQIGLLRICPRRASHVRYPVHQFATVFPY